MRFELTAEELYAIEDVLAYWDACQASKAARTPDEWGYSEEYNAYLTATSLSRYLLGQAAQYGEGAEFLRALRDAHYNDGYMVDAEPIPVSFRSYVQQSYMAVP